MVFSGVPIRKGNKSGGRRWYVFGVERGLGGLCGGDVLFDLWRLPIFFSHYLAFFAAVFMPLLLVSPRFAVALGVDGLSLQLGASGKGGC